MSHAPEREIQDTPVDREAMRAIGTTYDITLDIDYEDAPIEQLDDVWGKLVAPYLAAVSEEQFSAFEAGVERQFAKTKSNMVSFVRERVADLLLLITDWRWQTWALHEEAAGRNPYTAAA